MKQNARVRCNDGTWELVTMAGEPLQKFTDYATMLNTLHSIKSTWARNSLIFVTAIKADKPLKY